jgi:hypothetical protein
MDMNPSGSKIESGTSIKSGFKLKADSEVSSPDFAYISEVLKEKQPVSANVVPVVKSLGKVREISNSGRKHLVLFPKKKLRGFVVIVWSDSNIIAVSRGKDSLFIGKTKEGFKMLDPHFRPVNLKPVEVWGFEGMEKFAASRGYIWGRTLPLLKNAIFVGYGPDTFPGHFPNYDLVGKLKYGFTIFKNIEKPHNMYLQLFFNFGLLALLAFFSLILLYCMNSIKKIGTASDESFEFVMAVGILAGIIGYLAAGVFNDSVVTVAPVFWTLLGMGIAINQNPSNKGTAS